MPSNNPLRYLLVILVLFSIYGKAESQGLPPLTHGLTPVDGGAVAPPLRFRNLDDEWIDIGDFHGKVVIVNFWATWCPPCRREMGSLEKLYQAAGEQKVEVLAVNVGEDSDTVFSFLGTIEPYPNFQMLFDTDAESLDAWEVKGLPTTFVVGPKGRIAYRAVGGREFDHPEIVKKILALIPGA